MTNPEIIEDVVEFSDDFAHKLSGILRDALLEHLGLLEVSEAEEPDYYPTQREVERLWRTSSLRPHLEGRAR